MLRRFVQRGGGGFAAGMRFSSLRRRYAEEYALLEAESLNSHPFSSFRRESMAATKKPGPLPGIGSGPCVRRSFVERCLDRSSRSDSAPPALASPPSPHLYREMGMVMIGLGVRVRRTRGRGPSRSSKTILPIHSGQTPLLYGRNGIGAVSAHDLSFPEDAVRYSAWSAAFRPVESSE
jgi:hypothetical protein